MMDKVKRFAKALWINKQFSQWVTWIMVVGHFGLGLTVIIGGVDRFSIPSYNPLIDFSFGRTWLWGVWILISGILMALPAKWPNIIGLWLGMFWHLIWTACFTIATLNFPTAASTPIPAYGVMALLCTALLTAKVVENYEE